jgi:hypothetical protein
VPRWRTILLCTDAGAGNLTTLSIRIKRHSLCCVSHFYCFAECHYAECRGTVFKLSFHFSDILQNIKLLFTFLFIYLFIFSNYLFVSHATDLKCHSARCYKYYFHVFYNFDE